LHEICSLSSGAFYVHNRSDRAGASRPKRAAKFRIRGRRRKIRIGSDTAVIQFNISAQEETSQAAYQHASKDAEQVREYFAPTASNQIRDRRILSVQPMYDRKNAKQKLIGYRVTTDVTLKLKDFSKIGPSRSNSPTPTSAKDRL